MPTKLCSKSTGATNVLRTLGKWPALVVFLADLLKGVGAIVFALRRALPPAEDPGIAELKRRLAAGEISPVEYEVRVRAIEKGDM